VNIKNLPKVLLHDHLDGGLRPATVIELANEYGYTKLPTTDVDDLAEWFNAGAKRNDLVLYLETFAHTVGVMQHLTDNRISPDPQHVRVWSVRRPTRWFGRHE
jgi:adenosine deaminase